MSDLAALAARLRPYEIRDDAFTSPEFAEAWGVSEGQARANLRKLVAEGRLVKCKTRREYEQGAKVVPAYAEADNAPR